MAMVIYHLLPISSAIFVSSQAKSAFWPLLSKRPCALTSISKGWAQTGQAQKTLKISKLATTFLAEFQGKVRHASLPVTCPCP